MHSAYSSDGPFWAPGQRRGPFADPIFRPWTQRAQWLADNIHNPSSLMAVPAPVTAVRAAPLRGHHFCSSSCPLVVDPHAANTFAWPQNARGHTARARARAQDAEDAQWVRQLQSYSTPILQQVYETPLWVHRNPLRNTRQTSGGAPANVADAANIAANIAAPATPTGLMPRVPYLKSWLSGHGLSTKGAPPLCSATMLCLVFHSPTAAFHCLFSAWKHRYQ